MLRYVERKLYRELLKASAYRNLTIAEQILVKELELILYPAAQYVQITQLGECGMSSAPVTPTPNGTPLGGTSTFVATFLQSQGGAAGTLQANAIPQWSSTDTNVTLTQSADGTQATVVLNAAETATSYPLTVTAINSDGKTITNTIQVPVLPAIPPPPPDTAAEFIQIAQTA